MEPEPQAPAAGEDERAARRHRRADAGDSEREGFTRQRGQPPVPPGTEASLRRFQPSHNQAEEAD